MKTTMQIRFWFTGVEIYDDIILGNGSEPELVAQARSIRDTLEAAAAPGVADPIVWSAPPPKDDEYVEALFHYAESGLNPKVTMLIKEPLDKLAPIQSAHLSKATFGKSTHELLSTASAGRQYRIAFKGPQVCMPCGVGLHKCDGVIEALSYSTPAWTFRTNTGYAARYHFTATYLFKKE